MIIQSNICCKGNLEKRWGHFSSSLCALHPLLPVMVSLYLVYFCFILFGDLWIELLALNEVLFCSIDYHTITALFLENYLAFLFTQNMKSLIPQGLQKMMSYIRSYIGSSLYFYSNSIICAYIYYILCICKNSVYITRHQDSSKKSSNLSKSKKKIKL